MSSSGALFRRNGCRFLLSASLREVCFVQKFMDLLIGRLTEIFIPFAHRMKRIGYRGTNHFIRFAAEQLARIR